MLAQIPQYWMLPPDIHEKMWFGTEDPKQTLPWQSPVTCSRCLSCHNHQQQSEASIYTAPGGSALAVHPGFHLFIETESQVAQAGRQTNYTIKDNCEFLILLHPTPQCWVYMLALSCLDLSLAVLGIKCELHARWQACVNWPTSPAPALVLNRWPNVCVN